ncbi:AfsR/SARP family transcriptional regulator [Micromonospora sp. NPDC047548]|uniref:AfsR/SARP family transcriptional regulator n=1 Tax=Micromonospora sp. NPDC047548 TaxID=3155624 RepID=UPI0033CF6ABC
MRYELLGPVRVVNGNKTSSVSARKVEMLLAALLIRSDRVVGTDQLMIEIWGENPPRRATAGLHVYISQLRKFLTRVTHGRSPILTTQKGYLLSLGSHELDVHIFQRMIQQGRNHHRAGQLVESYNAFQEALDLWRGPALGGLHDGPLMNSFAGWAEQARLACLEELVDAALLLGRHRQFIGFLYSLTTEYPLREAFHRQLMLALYRSGCQADALNVYQSLRTVLKDELGLEPCRMLKDLQRAILLGDPGLEVCAAA